MAYLCICKPLNGIVRFYYAYYYVTVVIIETIERLEMRNEYGDEVNRKFGITVICTIYKLSKSRLPGIQFHIFTVSLEN